MNDTLVEALKGLVADLVAFKLKAHGYHWNVEGDDFREYHALFGDIYADAEGSIDSLAENIRKLDAYAPFKLSRLTEMSKIPESDVTSNPMSLSADLLISNEMIIASLMDAFDVANSSRQQGIANFLAERIDSHQKWSWQLRSSVKDVETD